MYGINLNNPILYHNASLRYFYENECHVTRLCPCDVLLLVFDGILRFSENNKEIEVKAGEYYIQRKGCFQKGTIPSDKPQYLYVHFEGDWTNIAPCLPLRGNFNYEKLKPFIEKMHCASHSNENQISQLAIFYSLLTTLHNTTKERTTAEKIAEYLIMHSNEDISLETLCKNFHFSKNYIILLFKEKHKLTPFTYLLSIRLENAKKLLLNSTQTAEQIAFSCGFSDYSHFYKAFKSSTSLSPNNWRKHYIHSLAILS